MPFQKHRLYILLWISAVFLVTSCQKKEEVTPQPAKVTIDVVSPVSTDVFKKGDSIKIKANVSYISQMHGYEIRITNKTTGKLVGEFEGHAHSEKFTIAEAWQDTVTTPASIHIEIKAMIDHNGNEATYVIEVQSQP